MLDAARARRATALGKIARDFVLERLRSLGLRARWTAQPLIVTTPRDAAQSTQATHAQCGLRLVEPGVLYGSCGAQDAAAFLRNSFHRGALHEFIAECFCPSTEPLEDALTILFFVV